MSIIMAAIEGPSTLGALALIIGVVGFGVIQYLLALFEINHSNLYGGVQAMLTRVILIHQLVLTGMAVIVVTGLILAPPSFIPRIWAYLIGGACLLCIVKVTYITRRVREFIVFNELENYAPRGFAPN